MRAAPDPARAERFADALAARLNADHANVKTVFYKIDAGAFADRAMLYMPAADLDALAQKLRAAFPMLGGYAADPSLAGLFRDRECGNRPPGASTNAARNAAQVAGQGAG